VTDPTEEISDTTIERVDGALIVRWDPAEAPVQAVVSPSPDEPHALDGAELELGDDHLRITLNGQPHRIYVHLFGADGSHRVVAERLVPLEGTLNFRDIGGYRAYRDGRVQRVRWGRVYRADGLATLTDADLQVLEALGVAVVCDFRGPHELAEAPSRVIGHDHIELVEVSISDGSDGKPLFQQIVDQEVTGLGVEEMTAFYSITLDSQAEVFGRVLERIADPAQHAVVFHCTAGKDRTGMLAAVLLSTLGVPDDVILADYELTNGFRSARRAVVMAELADRGVSLDAFLPFFTAVPDVLARSLDELRARWGSIDGYLTDHAGLAPATLEALRAQLLV
jgi:protein-tyrosine phosphatase